jgi:hypothetical protein
MLPPGRCNKDEAPPSATQTPQNPFLSPASHSSSGRYIYPYSSPSWATRSCFQHSATRLALVRRIAVRIASLPSFSPLSCRHLTFYERTYSTRARPRNSPPTHHGLRVISRPACSLAEAYACPPSRAGWRFGTSSGTIQRSIFPSRLQGRFLTMVDEPCPSSDRTQGTIVCALPTTTTNPHPNWKRATQR